MTITSARTRKQQLLRDFVTRKKAPTDPYLDEHGGIKCGVSLIRETLAAKYKPLGLQVPEFETVKTWFYGGSPPESVLALLYQDTINN